MRAYTKEARLVGRAADGATIFSADLAGSDSVTVREDGHRVRTVELDARFLALAEPARFDGPPEGVVGLPTEIRGELVVEVVEIAPDLIPPRVVARRVAGESVIEAVAAGRSAALPGLGETIFDRVPVGRYEVSCEAQRHEGDGPAAVVRRFADVTAGRTTYVAIDQGMERAVLVHGRVLLDGDPVPDAEIIAGALMTHELGGTGTARSNASGEYELKLPHPGLYSVAVRSTRHAGSTRVEIVVPFVERFEHDIRLPSTRLHGVISTPSGAGLAGAGVLLYCEGDTDLNGGMLRSASTLANEDGEYEFRAIPPGAYSVRAGGPAAPYLAVVGNNDFGLAIERVDVDEGSSTRVDLQLSPPLHLSGRVTADEGASIAMTARIYGSRVEASSGVWTVVALADERGRFEASALSRGEWLLMATSMQATPAASEIVRVTVDGQGSIPTDLILELKAAAIVELSAADDQGRSVPFVIDRITRGDVVLPTSGPNGQFSYAHRIGPLPVGEGPLPVGEGPLPVGEFSIAAKSRSGDRFEGAIPTDRPGRHEHVIEF